MYLCLSGNYRNVNHMSWNQRNDTNIGQVMHICIRKLTIIGSDNGLLPDQCQVIIWTNAGILSIGPWGTNFSEIWIEILTFPFKKMHLKDLSEQRRPVCLGLNVLIVFQVKNFQHGLFDTASSFIGTFLPPSQTSMWPGPLFIKALSWIAII